ncbi:hypothetical protein [Natrarchaeobius oligotrophus]|uniref:Uncharacterized protein n=1 Tax=Natrarchaeobius chitinivorans TaxID=1679083 RepID=A0A3N6PIU0_NATCH|nr:hypothetical protein [Natrarchaeobius chitinivorans]RQH00870.1 hypothetical protein EA472_09595 [Natrarchaeobius chitinivorans]
MVPDPASPPEDATSPSADSSGRGPFSRHVSRVADRFDDLLPFALVPVLLSVLEFDSVRRTVDQPPGWTSVNFEFAFPSPLLDLWRFVDPPDPSGSSGGVDVTVEVPFETVVLPLEAIEPTFAFVIGTAAIVYAAILGVVAAGYLGGIDRRLRGEPASIFEFVARYAARLILYNLAVFAALLVAVALLVVAPELLVFAFPAVVVLGYLFYAACSSSTTLAFSRDFGDRTGTRSRAARTSGSVSDTSSPPSCRRSSCRSSSAPARAASSWRSHSSRRSRSR